MLESPGSLTFEMCDVPALTAIARAHEVLDNDPGSYWESEPLKARIAGLYQSRHGVQVAPERIVLSCGASPALVMALMFGSIWRVASVSGLAPGAAEAMMLCHRVKEAEQRNTFFIADHCHPQTIEVIQTRAAPLGLKVIVGIVPELMQQHDYFAAVAQYPATSGMTHDLKDVIAKAHAAQAAFIVAADLLAFKGIAKAGFGLGDDRKRIIHKLGVEPQGILELNTVFHQRGYRKDMGVKGAVAVLFNQRFMKSKKAATSNWANARLTESQLVYAANDAYAAIRVWEALGLG